MKSDTMLIMSFVAFVGTITIDPSPWEEWALLVIAAIFYGVAFYKERKEAP